MAAPLIIIEKNCYVVSYCKAESQKIVCGDVSFCCLSVMLVVAKVY